MADLSSTPLQDKYSTTLASEITAADSSMTVSTAPSFALASGTFYATVDPGLSTQETMKVTAVSGTTLTITRSQPLFKGASSTAYAHAGGAKVVISDNWNYFEDIKDAVNAKLDSTQDSANFDQTVTATSWRIREDGGAMKLTDDFQSEVTLSTLAAASGADEKLKVSNADTTAGYLSGKVVATNGVKESITSPAGDERFQIEIDTTTLPTNLDEANTFFGATDLTGAEAETLSDTSEASTLHHHNLIESDIQGQATLRVSELQEVLSSGSSTSDSNRILYQSQAVDNSDCGTQTTIYSNAGFLDLVAANPQFNVTAQYLAATAQDGFIGYANNTFTGTSVENGAMTIDHCGFIIADGQISISVADGTTQSATNVAGTVTNSNTYRMTFDGTTATFYINGSLVGTRTSNVPDDNLKQFIYKVIPDSSGAQKSMRVYKHSMISYDI